MSHAFLNSVIFTAKVNTLCGIVGIWLKNESALVQKEQLEASINAIKHRGPDIQQTKIDANVGFAHARLSILDLSDQATQPMTDSSGRYTLIFNGEIYNYKDLIKKLPEDVVLKSTSDTEVLLQYLIHFGLSSLTDLNGFFSFVFYDHHHKELSYARDRYGIKPLLIYEDQDQIILASEISSFFSFDINRSLNKKALHLLFQLTYIPAPHSILEQVKSILPGHAGTIKNGVVEDFKFYDINHNSSADLTYDEALRTVKTKVESAVKKRLMSDVPLGTFLSGGVDSSIISLVAKQFKRDLKTFSIGFDERYFDESEYAIEMAESISSNHHQIQLTKEDFIEKFQSFLNLNHQPFADSSAFAVYVLSQKTKTYVTVCLSGDGADELFGGYRKHEAEFKVRQLSGFKRTGIRWLSKLTSSLPKGRHGKWVELNRQLQKLNDGIHLSLGERYWRWLTFIEETEKDKLLKSKKTNINPTFSITDNLNSVFLSDQQFVLPNDMLTKVDRMSMSQGLEVRTPFLDHELVEFVNSLPSHFKVNQSGRKRILIDAFKDQLPDRIYNREKKGFEIPIFDWLKTEIKSIFESKLFSKELILSQNIFDYDYIQRLKKEVSSSEIGENVHLIWTLIIFQNWWYRNIWNV